MPDLASLCACPSCRSAPLSWGQTQVRCPGCEKVYPVEGGIPILLPGGEAPRLEQRWYAGAREVVPEGLARRLEPYRRYLRPTLTHKSRRARELVDRFVDAAPAGGVVLNVGAGATDFGPSVVNLEIEPAPGVHVVGVAEALPVRDGACVAVVLMAVLEHVQDATQVLGECCRVLRPGGRLLVDVPFVQGYHASPEDHRRFTEQGLRAELERHGLDVEASGIAVGPASAMAWIASEFLALLLSGRSADLYRLARLLTTWLALPIKYADAWLEGHPMAYTIPSAVWAIGKREEEPATEHPPRASADASERGESRGAW